MTPDRRRDKTALPLADRAAALIRLPAACALAPPRARCGCTLRVAAATCGDRNRRDPCRRAADWPGVGYRPLTSTALAITVAAAWRRRHRRQHRDAVGDADEKLRPRQQWRRRHAVGRAVKRPSSCSAPARPAGRPWHRAPRVRKQPDRDALPSIRCSAMSPPLLTHARRTPAAGSRRSALRDRTGDGRHRRDVARRERYARAHGRRPRHAAASAR